MKLASVFKAAVICLGTLATVSAAEAMPALSQVGTPAGVSIGGAQVDKAVVVVSRRVVRRPRVIIRRPAARVVRRTVIRRF